MDDNGSWTSPFKKFSRLRATAILVIYYMFRIVVDLIVIVAMDIQKESFFTNFQIVA